MTKLDVSCGKLVSITKLAPGGVQGPNAFSACTEFFDEASVGHNTSARTKLVVRDSLKVHRNVSTSKPSQRYPVYQRLLLMMQCITGNTLTRIHRENYQNSPPEHP